ncbi:hypothetical protein SBA6_590004 [Candidatus Sulfopaludibacter sp. SbA6]|nr:hypothetical protein SBA6_590004 [Candidatus Sulfopaludibacter sp. SbA6]
MLHHGGDPRSEAGPAQGGRGHHVQHRAVPPDLRSEAGASDLPDTGLTLELEAAVFAPGFGKVARAAHARAPRADPGVVRRSVAR